MSVPIKISDETYEALKEYCSKGERPSLKNVADLAIKRYLQEKAPVALAAAVEEG